MRKKFVLEKKSKDRSLLYIVLSFLAFGLLMIANSTVITSKSLYGQPYKFVFLQLGWVLVGLFCFFAFFKFDYRNLSKISYILFVVNIVLLILLAITGVFPCSTSIPFSPCINGANRWLFLNPPPLPPMPFLGVLGFQPGELAKLTIVLYLAIQLSKNIEKKHDLFMVYIVISGMLSGLILLQPNMSTAVMVFALGTIMYFVSGAPLKPVLILVPIMIVLVSAVILASPYRRDRLASLFSPDSSENGTSYHVKQALVALGSGGVAGVGLGQSKQKYQYLPEVASDSIFAIIGEEFGFIGATLLVFAYLYFIYKGFMVAKKSADLLGKLLAVGISSWFGIQFLINVASMTKLIPLTGVPIPLISYGGSSMVFSLMALGILANINEVSQI